MPPLFSVIVPLHDDRGVVFQAIEAWLAQRSESNLFELIVVDSGNPRLKLKIAKRLGTQDKIVSLTSTNEAQLYNLGANSATSAWLVFSEAHVVPNPDAVSMLLQRIQTTSCDAASLGTTHRTRSRLANVDAALMRRESETMRSLGLWRTVGLRGFLIRSELFQSLGAFNEDYLRFAETALAIRIVDSGYLLEEFPEVVLQHYDTDSIHELLNAMSAGRLGAHRFWEAEPELAMSYFHSQAPAKPPTSMSPEIARAQCCRIWRAISKCNGGAALHLFDICKSAIIIAALGWRGKRWLSVAVVYATYLCLLARMYLRLNKPANYEPFLELYRLLRERCADVGSIRFRSIVARRHVPCPRSKPTAVEAHYLEECGINFFPAEVYEGEQYCWSSPAAAILIELDSNAFSICLDARPTGGWLPRHPKLFLNGMPIPSEDVSEDGGKVTVFIRANVKREFGEAILSWQSIPFCPADSGLPDKRQLGVALIRAHVLNLGRSTSQVEKVIAA